MKKLFSILFLAILTLSVILTSCTEENVAPVVDNGGKSSQNGL